MHFYIHPVLGLNDADIEKLANQLEPHIRGLSVQEVTLRARVKGRAMLLSKLEIFFKTGRKEIELERRCLHTEKILKWVL